MSQKTIRHIAGIDSDELYRRHREAHRTDEYGEEHFQEAVERVLDANGIEYESEFVLEGTNIAGEPGGGRRVDIYIPKTDTAIELKLRADLRGLGQCAFYTAYHDEALLLTRSDKREIRDAIVEKENIHYAVCTPGITQDPPQFGFSRTTSVANFIDEHRPICGVGMCEEANDDA